MKELAVTYREKYVWELPVRVYHWISAVAITVLFLTGLFIAFPFFRAKVDVASQAYLMGWVKTIHFTAAYILLINFLARLYWALVGNSYAKFGGFHPWRLKWWNSPFKQMIKSYLFLRKDEPEYLGHNPLAALIHFLFIFCGTFFMVLSGFAIYSQINPGGFWDTLTGWMIPLFGGESGLRLAHHLVAWAFVTYFIMHIYAVIRHDTVNRSSMISSIVTGFKHRLTSETETNGLGSNQH